MNEWVLIGIEQDDITATWIAVNFASPMPTCLFLRGWGSLIGIAYNIYKLGDYKVDVMCQQCDQVPHPNPTPYLSCYFS